MGSKSIQLNKEEIKNLCLDGLFTDGGHHKQWYLERILIKLGYSLNEIKYQIESEHDNDSYIDWDEGIAP